MDAYNWLDLLIELVSPKNPIIAAAKEMAMVSNRKYNPKIYLKLLAKYMLEAIAPKIKAVKPTVA